MEAAKDQIRDATQPAQTIWLVDPNGFPRRSQFAQNVQNGHTYIDPDGKTRLRSKSEAQGWGFLQDRITAEEWAIWLDYHRQSDAAGGKIEPLPADKWPKGIKNPRERATEKVLAKYEPGAGAGASSSKSKGSSSGAPADPGASSSKSMRGA